MYSDQIFTPRDFRTDCRKCIQYPMTLTLQDISLSQTIKQLT